MVVADLPFPSGSHPRAVLSDRAVVITTALGEVHCYGLEDGAFQWKLGFSGAELLPPAVAAEGTVVARTDGGVALVDTAGEVIREWQVGHPIAVQPLVDGGTVFVASSSGTVSACSLAEGRVLWRSEVGGAIEAMAAGAGLLILSGERLTALDQGTGKPRWQFKGQGAFAAEARFDATGERLYVGDLSGRFYSLSTSRGKKRYSWDTGAAIDVPTRVEPARVYVASQAATVFVYNAGNGHEIWRASLSARPAAAPVRAGSRIVVVTLLGDIVEFDDEGRARGTPYTAPDDVRYGTLVPPRAALALWSNRVLLLQTGVPPPPVTTTTAAAETTTTAESTTPTSTAPAEPTPPSTTTTPTSTTTTPPARPRR
jgi:outer membrane protein assembly factor BamB